MPTDDESNRPTDETEGLLSGQQQSRSSKESSLWVQYSSYVTRAANALLYSNKLYVLFIFVPLGFVASALGWHTIAISSFNLIAIIPLSALVSYSSDELANHVGELVAELINATFGNVVELTVCHP
jgi:Ca2+:H+ antiporter